MNNDLQPIVLVDEEGIETTFNVVTKLDIEEKEYFLLSPEGEEDVVIAMQVVQDEDGEETLAPVENDFEIEMADGSDLSLLENN